METSTLVQRVPVHNTQRPNYQVLLLWHQMCNKKLACGERREQHNYRDCLSFTPNLTLMGVLDHVLICASVSKTKINGLKKGLRKQQMHLAAKKKEFVSKNLTAPDELIRFLQSESTIEDVLKAGDAILLRR